MARSKWTEYPTMKLRRFAATNSDFDLYDALGEYAYVVAIHTKDAGDTGELHLADGTPIAFASGDDTTTWMEYPISTLLVDATSSDQSRLYIDAVVATGQVNVLAIVRG